MNAVSSTEELPHGVEIRTCILDSEGEAGLAADWPLLNSAEALRAGRFRFERDRHRYVRGRAFLRRSLAVRLARSPAGIDLVEGPNGKPALACGSLDFNLSHSGGLAVLAISTKGPVGLDVELLDRRVDADALAEACFTPFERSVLASLPPGERIRRFFIFWTAKEARMKLTGEGMALAPREIELDLAGGTPRGCLRPDDPVVHLDFVPIPDGFTNIDAICCLARLDEHRGRLPEYAFWRPQERKHPHRSI